MQIFSSHVLIFLNAACTYKIIYNFVISADNSLFCGVFRLCNVTLWLHLSELKIPFRDKTYVDNYDKFTMFGDR